MSSSEIVQGLLNAIDHLDSILPVILASDSDEEVIEKLSHSTPLSELQINALLDMRLSRLKVNERKPLLEMNG